MHHQFCTQAGETRLHHASVLHHAFIQADLLACGKAVGNCLAKTRDYRGYPLNTFGKLS